MKNSRIELGPQNLQDMHIDPKYGKATCYMCGKVLRSCQGFEDHVYNCQRKDGLYSVIPLELIRCEDSDSGSDSDLEGVELKPNMKGKYMLNTYENC